MEYLETIINTTINSFDFTYCLIVNLLTYFVIKIIDELNKDKEVKKIWCEDYYRALGIQYK